MSDNPKRACWIDGEECTYGHPEGKFILRPVAFCYAKDRPSHAGCSKINDSSDELWSLLLALEQRTVADLINPTDLEGDLAENSIILSDKLRDLAKNFVDEVDQEKKAILEKAAEILEEAEEKNTNMVSLNPEIVESIVIDRFL